MKVLVTGAGGFIGRRLCAELARNGYVVRALMRKPGSGDWFSSVEQIFGDIADRATITAAVRGMDSVVHLAARAHVMRDPSLDPLSEYRRVNVEGTRAVLEAMRVTGATSFVLASSVKAVGETSSEVWNSSTVPEPVDPYGISKLEAESLLHDFRGDVASTVMRFPLVYGPFVRGNMLRLFDYVSKGLPVPVNNRGNARSLLFVGNASAAILRVLEADGAQRSAAAGRAFFVADGPAVDTAALVREVASALGVRPRTFSLPFDRVRTLLLANNSGMGPRPSGVAAILNRLGASLEVDHREFVHAFGFTPPFTLRQGLKETAQWYTSR